MTTDNTQPDGAWAFDEQVTEAFDDMLLRSIPQYEVMRNLCTNLAMQYAQKHTAIVDIGCSRGEAIGKLIDQQRDIPIIRSLGGVDTSGELDNFVDWSPFGFCARRWCRRRCYRSCSKPWRWPRKVAGMRCNILWWRHRKCRCLRGRWR